MAKLTPVDFDPFAAPAASSAPASPRLTPVDFDPFAPAAAPAPTGGAAPMPLEPPLPPARPADLEPSMAGLEPPLPPKRPGDLDTGMNVPEPPASIAAQQAQVGLGDRKAVMHPKGTPLPVLPPGMGRIATPRGVFDYDPQLITPQAIKRLSMQGRENEILGLGPVSKPEVDKEINKGATPVVITERQPDGTEVKSAVGTGKTAGAQAAALEAGKLPGSTIDVENPQAVALDRLAKNPPLPPARPAGIGDPPLAPTQPVDALALDDPGAFRDRYGSQAGMLTGDEAHKERQGALAGADAAYDEADARWKAANERMQAIAGAGPARRGTSNLRQQQAVQAEFDAATKVLQDARAARDAAHSAAGSTVSISRDAASRAAAALAKMPREVAEGAMIPFDKLVYDTGFSDRMRAQIERIERESATDPTRNEQFWAKMGQGGGSLIGFIMGGAAGKALGAPAWLVSGGLGGLQNSADAYRDAEKVGGTAMQKTASYLAGLGAGATEAFGVGGVLDKLDRASGGGFRRYAGFVLAQKGEEGLQEWSQTVMDNLRQYGVLGKPIPEVTQGAWEAAAIGAILGGATAATLGLPTALRGNTPIPDIPDDVFNVDPFGRPLQQGQPTEPARGQRPAPPQQGPQLSPEGAVIPGSPIPNQEQAAPESGTPTGSGSVPSELPAPTGANGGGGNAPGPSKPATLQDEDSLVLQAAGYSPDDIADMSPEQRAAEAAAAREEGYRPEQAPPAAVTPAEPSPQSPNPIGVDDDTGAAPPPPNDELNYESSGGQMDVRRRRLQTMTVHKNENTGRYYVTDDRNGGAIRSAGHATPEAAVAANKADDDRRVLGPDGSRNRPVTVTSAADLEAVRPTVNTEPTPAQIEAGNYKKGHVRFDGFDVTIENPKGSTRRGTDPDGNAWESTLPADYGYIKGTAATDGDHVDVYIGEGGPTGQAFVIEQVDPKTGKFDEPKIVLGVRDADEARQLYYGAFSDGSGPSRVGLVANMPVERLRQYLDRPGRTGKVPKWWRGEGEASNAGENLIDPPAEIGVTISEGATVAPSQPPQGVTLTPVDFDPFDAAFDAGQDEADTAAPPQAQAEAENNVSSEPEKGSSLHLTPLAQAKPGDQVEEGRELVQKGMSRKDADALAKRTKRAKVIPDGRKWAVIAPPEKAKEKRAPRDKGPKGPVSLVAFLRSKGGIKDERGELRARDMHKRHPGLVNNKKGMALDEAREIAAEAGYLRPGQTLDGLSLTESAVTTTTINDFLDALDAHPVYPVQDEAKVADKQAEAEGDDVRARLEAVMDDIRTDMLESGIRAEDIDPAYLEAAAGAVLEGMFDANSNAYEWAVLNRWREDDSLPEEARPDEFSDIPFFPDELYGYEPQEFDGELPEPVREGATAGETAQDDPADAEGAPEDEGQSPGRAGARPSRVEEAGDSEETDDQPADPLGPREALVQASDADEAVRITLTREGPWDFNDTWPDVDPAMIEALANEGRDPFGSSGELPSVENVYLSLDDMMSQAQSAFASQMNGRKTLAAIKKGEHAKKKAPQLEKLKKNAEKDVQDGIKAAREIAGEVGDLWGRKAAAALLREARRRENTQEASAPGATAAFAAQVESAAEADKKARAESAGQRTEDMFEPRGVTDSELKKVVEEFNDFQSRMLEGEQITHVFDPPAKSEIVRVDQKVKVYHAEHGWMTPEQAKRKISEWRKHALEQGKTGANSRKVVLSLFDYTGKWSQPWEEAGYQVYRFDIQNGDVLVEDGQEINTGDVNNFSVEFFADMFGDFNGGEIHAILAACPCTDFASSGARHFEAKDKDGRTLDSVKLVHQTLATIEFYKPAVWAIENPVGRIEELGGLPPWRSSWMPNHFGEPYTKRTLLWGRFNADMPIAPVEPLEGSKMWAKYGGKSQKTKNARSETPVGFAYAFFMANNAVDNPVMALANKYDRLDRGAIEQAVKAGLDESQIGELVDDFYYMDLDDEAANKALRDAAKGETPAAEPVDEKAKRRAEFQAHLEEQRAKRKPIEDAVRAALAMKNPRLVATRTLRPGVTQKIVLSKGFEDSPYRVTSFDDQGPSGHRDYRENDFDEIVREFIGWELENPPAAAPTTEKGADNKPQLVIPGAEKIGDGQLAQIKADAPLKPKVPQKDVGGLFGDDSKQSDLMDMLSAPPAEKPKDAKAERVEALRKQLVTFASGLSRIGDLNTAGNALGGNERKGVGVDIGELTNPAIGALARAVIDWRAQVFVDSGAFSMFRRNMRKAQDVIDLFGKDEAPKAFEAMDFDRLLERYDALLEHIAGRNPSEENDYPRPLMVMPDIVGDQAGSLALVELYKKEIKTETEFNTARPVVPIQKGELTLAQAYARVVEILGTDNFIVGIPSNEKAVTNAELLAFLKDAKPKRIHFLGSASEKTLGPKLEAIAEAGLELEHLSADANILRARLYGRTFEGETRADGIKRVLAPELSEQAADPFDSAFDEGQDEADGTQEESEEAKAARRAEELEQTKAKGRAIIEWISQPNRSVSLPLNRKLMVINRPDALRIGKDGVYLQRGKSWDFLFSAQVDQLFAQLGPAAKAAVTGPAPVNPGITPTPTPPPTSPGPAPQKPARAKKPKGPTQNERLRNYFRPGRVIKGSYGWDKVLEVDFAGQYGFTVTVQSVDKDGKPNGFVRSHSTVPTDREFKAWEKENPVPGYERTTGEVASSAVKNLAGGADAALSGLSALFNSKGRPSSGFTFDEDTWKAAKPLFIEAGRKFKAFANDVAELVKRMVVDMRQNHGLTREGMEAMRPYMRRFVDDLRSGAISLEEQDDNAPSLGDDLESDSGATAPQDGMGGANVPAAGGGAGSRSGPRGGSAGGRGGRSRVPAPSAPIVGADGNLELPEREPEPAISPTDVGEPAGSDGDGDGGLFADTERDEDAARAAQQAANLEARKQAQARVGASAQVIPTDPKNIAATLPLLFPEQQDDVRRAETRYAAGKEPGFLLTNGTGTGKTFSGLGVLARRFMAGERDMLVIAPSQGILTDWIKAAALFGVPMQTLDSTTTNGTGVVATTYANLGANRHLVDRPWSFIIADEAHKLTQGGKSQSTSALDTFRAITGHPNGLHTRVDHIMRAEWDALRAIDKRDPRYDAKARELLDKRQAILEGWRDGTNPLPGWQGNSPDRINVLFMSATPFAYHKSLDYAEGYLFSYGERESTGYNQAGGRDSFFIENLGYRMRYNKLTSPDADVDTGVMERELHERMKREGALWGRALEVERDYDRKFVLIEDALGAQIDTALSWLSKNGAKFRKLSDIINEQFDYLSRMRLLEAMKARAAVPYIRKQHALGRKVVVFHDYNEGGGFNPFELEFPDDATFSVYEGNQHKTYNAREVYAEFLAANPYVRGLKFSGYRAPIAELTANFPGALVYNGTIPQKKREEAKRLFNTDGNTSNLIIVQSAAGEAGISLHDITNVHQRVLLNLGMPIRPTTAIQQEGRIYRVGQLSDAMFRYMNTGTNWERWAFASKIATRAGTAENLAMGNQARTLRQSFIDAFEASDHYEPGEEGEGKGGKAADRLANSELTEFEKAKTHYFAIPKNTKKRSNREGVDYFPTPEPLGLKMVEWAGLKSNESVLEPSAGHGAIARYFPEDTHRTLVEQENELASKAALRAPGARIVVDRFENLNLVNKYDAIVMNPPFGVRGKTAIEHVQKAVKHLANGGRIVALIPDGAGMERLNSFSDSDEWTREGLLLIANIALPSVTFERAGTGVRGRVVIIEKQRDKEVWNQFNETKHRDLSNAETIGEFFDRIEQMSFPDRLQPVTKEATVAAAAAPAAAPGVVTMDASKAPSISLGETKHAKTGADLFVVSLEQRVDRPVYDALAAAAKKEGGWYSSFKGKGAIPGFQFKSAEARDKFIAAAGMTKPAPVTQSMPAARTLTEGAEAAGMTIERLAEIATDVIQRVAPWANVRLHFGPLRAGSDNANAADGDVIEGSYTATRALIQMSLTSTTDPRNTSHHEAFHALQDAGVFTEQEIAVMAREAARLRQQLTRYYPDAPQWSLIETTAGAYGYYAAARDSGLPVSDLHIGVRRYLEKAYQIFRRIGNALRGLGFQTAEDIFERARTGEMAGRFLDNGRQTSSWMFDAAMQATQHSMARPTRVDRPRSRTSKAIEYAVDRFVRMRELQNEYKRDTGNQNVPDVFRALGALETRIAARVENAVHEELNPVLDAIRSLELSPATRAAIASDALLGDGEDILNRYLYVRHAEERNDYIATFNPAKPDGGSGIMTAQAQAELAAFQADPRFAEIDAAARRVDAIILADLQGRLAAGLISQQQFRDLRNMFQHFVPLRGFQSEEFENGTPLAGVGLSLSRRETPIVKGRGSLAGSIVAQTMKMRVDGIERAEKNRVDLMLYRFAQMMQAHYGVNSPLRARRTLPMTTGGGSGRTVVPVPDLAYPTQDTVITAKVDGQGRYVEFVGEGALVDQLKNSMLTPDDAAMRGVGRLTQFLGGLWTRYNPLYPAIGSPRDMLEAVTAAEALLGRRGVRTYLKNLPVGHKEAIAYVLGHESPEFRRFRLAGGKMSWATHRSLDEIEREIADRLNGLQWGNAHRKVFGGLGHVLESWNDIFETAHRFALYKAALDLGLPEAQAVKAALEGTLNFHRRGKGELVRIARMMHPFVNPGLQAPIRAARLIDEAGGIQTAAGKKALAGAVVRGLTRTYAVFIVLGFIQGAANYATGGDDEDDKMPWWDKARDGYQTEKNIVLYTGGKDAKGRPNAFMIPAFPEITFPMAMGNAIASMIWGKRSKADIAKDVAKAAWQLSPTHGRGIVPSLLAPIWEIYYNRNAFDRPIHKTDTPQNRGVPNYEEKLPRTEQFWQDLARGLGKASGGTAEEAGVINLHPEDYRHIARHFSGAWYQIAEQIASATGYSPSDRTPIVARRFYAPGEELHTQYERNKFDKGQAAANAKRAAVENKFADPNAVTDKDRQRNRMQKRAEIAKEGAAVTKGGGITTPSKEVFDTGREVMAALSKRRDAILVKPGLSAAERQSQAQAVGEQINAARKKYSQMAADLAAGRLKYENIRGPLARDRAIAKRNLLP
jgi:hypothetical protein